MAPKKDQADPVAYPALKRSDLDLIITALALVHREGSASHEIGDTGPILGQLLGYYTRRWGLPESIRQMTER